MKTPIIITVFALILGLSFRGRAQTVQYVTLYSPLGKAANYALQTNQVVSLVGISIYGTQTPNVTGAGPDGGIRYLFPTPLGSLQIVTGLTNVQVVLVGQPGWATFQITTPASANVISNYVPADAIVIPANVTGNVQIILESSTDLLNWTAANPGTYSAASATNRFFRVRAVHN